MTHSGEKSNKCDQCEYASSKIGSLKAHLKIHGGETFNNVSMHPSMHTI